MRLLPLFLIFAVSLFGAWDSTNDDIIIEWSTNTAGEPIGCFYVIVDTDDTLGTVRVAIDKNADTSDGNKGLQYTSVGGYFNTRLCVELEASTDYYLTIETSGNGNFTCQSVDTTGVLELLKSGDDLAAEFSCPVSGEPIVYTSAGTQPTAPAAPDLPTTTDDYEADVFGATFTTTWTVSETAGVTTEADFSTALSAANTAFTSNCNNWYKIELAQGTTLNLECDGSDATFSRLLDWPANSCTGSNTGGIVVATAGDAKLFPPQGTHSDPTFAPIYATIRRKGLCEWDGWMIRTNSGTSRIFFKNLNIVHAPAGSIDAQLAFDAMDSTTALSIPATVPTDDNDWGDNAEVAVVCNTPNEDTAGLTGFHTCSDCDKGDDPITLGTTFDNSTGCAGGGLVISRPTGWGITSISAVGRVVTSITHDGLTYPQLDATVTDLGDDGRIVLDAAMPSPGGSDWISNGDTIIVEGFGLGFDDRLCVVFNKTSNTTFDITGPDSDPTRCDPAGTSATGTIRIMKPLCIDYNSLDAANACWYYEVVDRNTLDLLEVTGAAPSFGGTGTGGYGSTAPKIPWTMITTASPTSVEIGFIHNNINAGAFPLRGDGINEGVCCGNTVTGRQWIGNYIEGAEDWAIRDPMDGSQDHPRGANGASAVNSTINVSGAKQDIRIERNKMHVGGFGIAGDSAAAEGTSDFAFNRNTMVLPDEVIHGHPANTGRVQTMRHLFELKTFHRLQLWGNRFKGQHRSEAQNPAPVIALKEGAGADSLATRNSVGHVSIMGNVAPLNAEFLMWNKENVTKWDGAGGGLEVGYNFTAVNYRALSYASGGNGGCWFRRNAPLGSINIHHNTIVHTSANNCEAFFARWHEGQASLVFVENNIIQVNGENGSDAWFVGTEGSSTSYSPAKPATDRNKDLWDYSNIVVGTNGSLARASVGGFDDNILIPGVEDARLNVSGLKNAMGDTADVLRMTQAEVIALTNTISLHTTTAQTVVNATTTDAAWEAVLGANSWTDIEPGYSGYGADTATIKRYTGTVVSVPVPSEVNATTIRYTMDGPVDLDNAEFGCSVDLSTDADFSTAGNITRKQFTAASGDQTLDFTVSAATNYYMRTHCPVNRYFGEVTVP